MEVAEAIGEFFASGVMMSNWMKTFVTLVSKKPNAVEPSQYRPIISCTTLYKIYSKLMVEKMKLMLLT